MPQKLSAFRERKLRFDASKAVRFSRIRHCINASLPQNRVRFSRPVKKNQGLTIVAKAEKTLSAYWLPRRRRKGSGGTTPLIAAQETWGSGRASPPASRERDVVVWLLVAERPSCLRDNPLRSSSESASPWSTTVGRQKASTAKPSLSWTACGGNAIPTTRRSTAACRPIARRSDGRRAAMIQSAVEGETYGSVPPTSGERPASPPTRMPMPAGSSATRQRR
jgi:hypothetical protein